MGVLPPWLLSSFVFPCRILGVVWEQEVRGSHFGHPRGEPGVVVPHLFVVVRFLPTSREGGGTRSTRCRPEKRASFRYPPAVCGTQLPYRLAGGTSMPHGEEPLCCSSFLLPYYHSSLALLRFGLSYQSSKSGPRLKHSGPPASLDKPTSYQVARGSQFVFAALKTLSDRCAHSNVSLAMASLSLALGARVTRTTERCNVRAEIGRSVLSPAAHHRCGISRARATNLSPSRPHEALSL